MILVALCAALVLADPQAFRSDHIWVNTDYRTKLAPIYSDKKILGQWALLEGQWDSSHIKTECPGLTNKVSMNDQGLNSQDILRIEVDGHRYCIPQGEEITVGDLEIGLVGISRDWVSFQDPATDKMIPFGNAELSIHRTNQLYLTIGLLLAPVPLGAAISKLIDAVTAMWKARRQRSPTR
jgi:hypothetical protein